MFGRVTRKRKIAYDRARHRDRHVIENAMQAQRLPQEGATLYDRFAANFLSASRSPPSLPSGADRIWSLGSSDEGEVRGSAENRRLVPSLGF
jgi:hypothetical protein